MDEHPVVYFEILGQDGAALRDFYGRLFGWEIAAVESNGGAYQRVAAQDGGIGGGIGAFPGAPSQVTFYVRCADLRAACDRAVELGGSVLMQPTVVAAGIESAMVADPEGHAVGLIHGV